jgi:predicted regulator of Ras-like GTPase activity (Roadblock/LC7/MglB family)
MRGLEASDALESIIAPYLDIDEVSVAALVSNDGLLIAVAGTAGLDLEAAAALAASTLASAAGLAGELAAGGPRLVALDLDGLGLVLAPLSGEMFLLLGGTPGILALARRGSLS